METMPSGSLTNETLDYQTSPNDNSWGWITGPNVPGILSWPAATYTVTLNITQPNPSIQITKVRIYRVDASGGPRYIGLLSLGVLDGLAQPLTNAGVLTFTVNGIASVGDVTDRLAVKFYTTNTSSGPQTFSYDLGTGSPTQVIVAPVASPTPAPSASPSGGPTAAPSFTPTPSPTASTSPAPSPSPTATL